VGFINAACKIRLQLRLGGKSNTGAEGVGKRYLQLRRATDRVSRLDSQITGRRERKIKYNDRPRIAPRPV
jgi:hypothetical protein